jgi:hypothetical protein
MYVEGAVPVKRAQAWFSVCFVCFSLCFLVTKNTETVFGCSLHVTCGPKMCRKQKVLQVGMMECISDGLFHSCLQDTDQSSE